LSAHFFVHEPKFYSLQKYAFRLAFHPL